MAVNFKGAAGLFEVVYLNSDMVADNVVKCKGNHCIQSFLKLVSNDCAQMTYVASVASQK